MKKRLFIFEFNNLSDALYHSYSKDCFCACCFLIDVIPFICVCWHSDRFYTDFFFFFRTVSEVPLRIMSVWFEKKTDHDCLSLCVVIICSSCSENKYRVWRDVHQAWQSFSLVGKRHLTVSLFWFCAEFLNESECLVRFIIPKHNLQDSTFSNMFKC